MGSDVYMHGLKYCYAYKRLIHGQHGSVVQAKTTISLDDQTGSTS